MVFFSAFGVYILFMYLNLCDEVKAYLALWADTGKFKAVFIPVKLFLPIEATLKVAEDINLEAWTLI